MYAVLYIFHMERFSDAFIRDDSVLYGTGELSRGAPSVWGPGLLLMLPIRITWPCEIINHMTIAAICK